MNAFLTLPAAERRLTFQQVESQMGLQAVSVEKDFWVCWTLRELFTLPGLGEHLTFKGGTSLSKAWRLIQRFSEDIDLVVNKEALGFGGADVPENAPSKGKRKERLEGLMGACRRWVKGTLFSALGARLQAALGGTSWRLEVNPDMPDGQCLLFHYPSSRKQQIYASQAAGGPESYGGAGTEHHHRREHSLERSSGANH